ncbi:hypothetical protein COL922a_014046, partial [Colletotrichum nupharicola]
MDYMCYDFNKRKTTGLEFMEKIEKDLENIFNNEILWDENFFGNQRNSRNVSLRAVCQFTPDHVDLSDYYPSDGVPKERPEGSRMKTVAECIELLPHLFSGHRRLKEARSSELRHLADLFEMYPGYLMSSKSGYYGVKNPRHITRELRGRARTWKKSRKYGNFFPATPKEMAWLDSFLRCVKWIESHNVIWAEDFQKYPSRHWNRSRRG